MIEKVQIRCTALGASGCYVLSLMKIAEEITGLEIDVLQVIERMIKIKRLGTDMTVLDAAALMQDLVGVGRFEVLKAGPGHALPLDYKIKSNEWVILRYGRIDSDGVEHPHFVVGDVDDRVAWDPWPESRTVSEGVLVSKRIIRAVK
jgi:hypothetical protein